VIPCFEIRFIDRACSEGYLLYKVIVQHVGWSIAYCEFVYSTATLSGELLVERQVPTATVIKKWRLSQSLKGHRTVVSGKPRAGGLQSATWRSSLLHLTLWRLLCLTPSGVF